jgi:uncharacterized protein (TIGR03437 family)
MFRKHPETRYSQRCGIAVLILAALPATAIAQGAKPVVSAVTNAANYTRGPVAAGEMVVIFGSSMGPSPLVTLQLDQSGRLTNTLSGVQVFFNGIASPLIYVSASQIAGMVPYAVGGMPSTSVQVSYQGVLSDAVQVAVAPSAPGIFSANASGTGQAAMTNSDGSLNSSAHPAAPGTYVTFYVSGTGQTDPAGSDGSVATGAANTVLPVSVTIGGQPAKVLYAGATPGQVDGFTQINAYIPPFLTSGGNLALTVQIGSATSQVGITVAAAAPPPKRTVILIHGILQGKADMSILNQALSSPTYGLDSTRFSIDSGFDWSLCANAPFCPSYCSLEEGATELANYIARFPAGHVILVGYSMGGLLARDLILNNRNQILNTHPVDALVTLGAPNAGYPHEAIDDIPLCTMLATEMASDWRSQQSTNTVTESAYLYQLNNAWTTGTLPVPNLHWLAVAGTFCSNPVRNAALNTGCRNSNPYSDGIVCADSADFNLAGMNLPTVRWNSPGYAHTNDKLFLGATLFDGCDAQYFTALDTPSAQSDLIQQLRSFISAQ